MKRSIRPVTLRRVIEVAGVAQRGPVNVTGLVGQLGVTTRRAKEILLELVHMGIVEPKADEYGATGLADSILDCYEREDWARAHELFLQNYDFYRSFVKALAAEEEPVQSTALASKLSLDKQLNFNQAAFDTMKDWAERLGVVQRNLYTDEYYLTTCKCVTASCFVAELVNAYNRLNTELRPGVRQEYVEIARLREEVSEALRIDRATFDPLLTDLFKRSIGKMDLCGAPLNSSSRKSPSSLRVMERGNRREILSPKLSTIKEGRGIEIEGKLYRYLAILASLEVQ